MSEEVAEPSSVKTGGNKITKGRAATVTTEVIICTAIYIAAFFVTPGLGHKIILIIPVILPIIAYIIPNPRDLDNRIAIGLMRVLAIAGILDLGYTIFTGPSAIEASAITISPRTQDMRSNSPVTMTAQLREARRHLTVIFGWQDGNIVGGCGIDMRLTIFGIYGYPKEPIRSVHIGESVSIDLQASRKVAQMQILISERDSACRGSLYILKSKAT